MLEAGRRLRVAATAQNTDGYGLGSFPWSQLGRRRAGAAVGRSDRDRSGIELGHDDADRSRYRGPEHMRAKDCPAGGNRATKRLDRSDPKPRRPRWA
jgi:hypothetical protein